MEPSDAASRTRLEGPQIDVHRGPRYDGSEAWPDERAAAERFATREIVDGQASSAPWRVVGRSSVGELLVTTHVAGTEFGPVLLGAAVDVKCGLVTGSGLYVDLALDEDDAFDEVRHDDISPEVAARAIELAKTEGDS